MGLPTDRHCDPYCRKAPRLPRGVQYRFFPAYLCLGATEPLLSIALLALALLSRGAAAEEAVCYPTGHAQGLGHGDAMPAEEFERRTPEVRVLLLRCRE